MAEDLGKLVEFFNRISAIEVVMSDKAMLKANNARILFEFRTNFIPQIFDTAGSNIGLPFDEKKSTNWEKYRVFPSAPRRNMQGVWTGETYESLISGEQKGSTVSILSKVDSRKIRFGYSAAEKRNVNIGLNDEFITEQTEKTRSFFEERIQKFLEKSGRA